MSFRKIQCQCDWPTSAVEVVSNGLVVISVDLQTVGQHFPACINMHKTMWNIQTQTLNSNLKWLRLTFNTARSLILIWLTDKSSSLLNMQTLRSVFPLKNEIVHPTKPFGYSLSTDFIVYFTFMAVGQTCECPFCDNLSTNLHCDDKNTLGDIS